MNTHYSIRGTMQGEELKDALREITQEHAPSFLESVKIKLGISDFTMHSLLAKFFTPDQLEEMKKYAQALDTFENIVFFLFLLYKSNSYMETYATVNMYLSTVFGSEYLVQKNMAAGAVTAASAAIFYALKGHKAKVISTESFGDDLSSLSSVFSHVLDSTIVKAISGILVLVTTTKMFSKDVAKDIYEVVGYPKPMNLMETAKYALDCIAKVVKAAENWFTGKMTFFLNFHGR